MTNLLTKESKISSLAVALFVVSFILLFTKENNNLIVVLSILTALPLIIQVSISPFFVQGTEIKIEKESLVLLTIGNVTLEKRYVNQYLNLGEIMSPFLGLSMEIVGKVIWSENENNLTKILNSRISNNLYNLTDVEIINKLQAKGWVKK